MAKLHPPTARLSLSASCLTLTADASASTTPQGTIIQYRFAFGDGQTSVQATPIAIHTYAVAATYTVSVVVVNSANLTQKKSVSIAVGSIPPPPPVPLPPPPPPPPPTVVSVAVAGPFTVTLGTIPSSYTAAATLSNGQVQDVTVTATWHSSNAAVFTMSAQAIMTMVAPGTAQVIAIYNNVTGSQSVTVTAPAPPPVVPPAVPSSPVPADTSTVSTSSVGLTWSAAGATSYSVRFGANRPPPPVGTTTTPSFTETTQPGFTYYWQIVATNSAGSTTGPVWSFIVPAVVPPPPPPPTLVSLAIAGPLTATVGQVIPYTATATFSDNSTLNATASSQWTTGNAAATITSAGLATAVSAGSVQILASYLSATAPSLVLVISNAAGSPPTTPTAVTPTNGATGVSLNPTLQWASANATSYTVKFGTVSPPLTVATNVTTTAYALQSALGTLTASTLYYWQIVATNGSGSTTSAIFSFTTQAAPPQPPVGSLVQASNLVALGSFVMPVVVGYTGLYEFDYANGAIAYNVANNSLFIVGHDWGQHVAEVSIPAYNGTSTVLQAFIDALYGKLPLVAPAAPNDTFKIGGLYVSGSSLVISGYDYYDAGNNATKSHFIRSTTLSSSTVTGPVTVGTLNPGFYAGYFADIPAAWQAALGGDLLVGMNGIPIVSRTSYGPAAFVVTKATLIAGTNPTPAQPLVYYDQAHETLGGYGQMGVTNPLYNGTAKARGVLIPPGTSTCLFFGSTSLGPYCYGLGTNDPTLAFTTDPVTGDTFCYDPANSAKGEHGYPYSGYVWAYNLNDFAAVVAGTKNPWDIVPYASWTIPVFVSGLGYDVATGKIYLSAGGSPFTIQVYQIQ